MTTLLKLAWRNLWRNRRRTLIIGSSVLFSAVFCILLLSFVNGTSTYIIDQTVEKQTGMFQLQHPDFFDDRTTDNFMVADSLLIRLWESAPEVKCLAPRIESFAIVWNGTRTRNVLFMGIDPEREAYFSSLNDRMVKGEYLAENDTKVLIGERMAQIMDVTLGDTLTLIGQGYHGESANGLYVVGGVLKAIDPLMDATVVYMALPEAQRFLSMPNGLSAVAVTLLNKRSLPAVVNQWSEVFPEWRFVRWEELIGNTIAGASKDKTEMMTYLYFLYVIVGFGLLSTIIMLTNERQREFGVMMALGTKRRTIIASLLAEVLMVGLLAIGASVVLTLPIVAYFHYHPVTLSGDMALAMEQVGFDAAMPFELSAGLFASQALIVAAMVLVVMVYPMIKIRSMSIIHSVRG